MDQETLDFLRRFKDGLDGTPETFAELEKRLNSYNKSLKSQQSMFQQWGDFFRGYSKEHRDVMNTFDDAIKKTKENMENLSDAEVDARVRKLEGMKAEGMLTASKNKATLAAKNFGKGVADSTSQVAIAALDFVRDLQSNKEGTEIIGAANIRAAKTTSTLTQTLGQFGQVVGTLLTLVPGVGIAARVVGGAIALLGTAAEAAAPKLSEIAEKGLTILNTEVEKTKKSFREISSTGAYFGSGMTELRQIARDAGIEVGTLGEIVKGSSESLSNMGMGINEAIKRFSGINRAIRDSDLAMQFRRLGMDAKQYGSAALDAAAMLQASGKLREMGDEEVASYTLEYVKNLKILQNITGEDARKKLESARKASMEADLYARAMAEGGKDGVKRMMTALGTVPEVLKVGAMQYISSGGRAITDIGTRVMMARNPEIEKYYATLLRGVRSGNASIEEVQKSSMEQLQRVGDYALENHESMGRIGEAGRLSGNSILQGAAAIQTGLIELGMKIRGIDYSQQQKEMAATIKGGSDAIGTNIHELDEKVVTMQSILGEKLTPALDSYTKEMNRAYDIAKGINDGLEAVVEWLTSQGFNKPKPVPAAPMQYKAPIAQSLDQTYFQKGPAESYDDYSKRMREWAERQNSITNQGKAKGGISTGPLSGYQEVLHGTEAVVPLPDNKSIPVTLDTSTLSQSLERNNGLLAEIVKVLRTGNNNTSHIARSIA